MTHAPSRVLVIVGTVVAVLGAATTGSAADRSLWNLPPGFPTPRVPADNPMSREKAVLGRFLFYDTRLSGNQTRAPTAERSFARVRAVDLSLSVCGLAAARLSASTPPSASR